MAKRKTAETPTAVLKRDPVEYSMESLLNPAAWTEREMRREYSRLRKIANKRLEALGRSEFAWSRAYQQNKGGFASIPRNASRREVAAALKQVTGFVSAKTSSVTGQRAIQRQTLKTLKEHGYSVEKKQLREFGLFMEYVRDNYGSLYHPSDMVVEMFQSAQRAGISANDLVANFEFWRQHQDELLDVEKKVKPAKGKKTATSADLARDLGLTDYKKKRNVNLDNYHSRKMAAKTGG